MIVESNTNISICLLIERENSQNPPKIGFVKRGLRVWRQSTTMSALIMLSVAFVGSYGHLRTAQVPGGPLAVVVAVGHP